MSEPQIQPTQTLMRSEVSPPPVTPAQMGTNEAPASIIGTESSFQKIDNGDTIGKPSDQESSTQWKAVGRIANFFAGIGFSPARTDFTENNTAPGANREIGTLQYGFGAEVYYGRLIDDAPTMVPGLNAGLSIYFMHPAPLGPSADADVSGVTSHLTLGLDVVRGLDPMSFYGVNIGVDALRVSRFDINNVGLGGSDNIGGEVDEVDAFSGVFVRADIDLELANNYWLGIYASARYDWTAQEVELHQPHLGSSTSTLNNGFTFDFGIVFGASAYQKTSAE